MSSPKDPENAVGYAGIPGANSDLACRAAHPYMEGIGYSSFDDVFEAVASDSSFNVENSFKTYTPVLLF